MTNAEVLTPIEYVTQAARDLDTAHDGGGFVEVSELIDLFGAARALALGLGHTEQEVAAAIQRGIA
ncbi:hypothetical protein ACFYVR_25120 [Rhodococcus sp. NPDC003318]|uniref:hypothetical protein n=1 Tax=Rhodococcus sp. NPDC003318 TaxID=3364503 RepID=UPI0036A10B24